LVNDWVHENSWPLRDAGPEKPLFAERTPVGLSVTVQSRFVATAATTIKPTPW